MKKLLLLIVCALLSSTASFAIVGQTNRAATPQFSEVFNAKTLTQQLTEKTTKVTKSAVQKAKDLKKTFFKKPGLEDQNWLLFWLGGWGLGVIFYILAVVIAVGTASATLTYLFWGLGVLFSLFGTFSMIMWLINR